MLTYLTSVARGPSQRFEVLAQLVSSLFDTTKAGAIEYLKTSPWKKCVLHMLDMLKILQVGPCGGGGGLGLVWGLGGELGFRGGLGRPLRPRWTCSRMRRWGLGVQGLVVWVDGLAWGLRVCGSVACSRSEGQGDGGWGSTAW